jgi:GT2 family glycosyltransferase
VTAVVVAYGETPRLADAVDRLLGSADVAVDVVVVDNGSRDGSVEAVGDRAGVTVVVAPSNGGFGAGCNLGVAHAAADVVAFVNPDVLVEPGALHLLVAEAARPDVGIASASVRLLHEPGLLNSAGGAIHFLGLGWAEGYRQPVADTGLEDRDVIAASGAAMVMLRSRFLELGGFTEELFLYHEDAELSLRCWLHGWRVRYVAAAVVLHDYEFGRNPRKLHLLERNRLIVVLTCYSTRMLLLVAPALIAYEAGVLVLSVAQGWAREKVDGWTWLVRNAGWLREHRRRVQRDRRRPDRELVPLFSARFTGGQVEMPRAVEPGDRILGAYWTRVSRWL